MFTDIHSHFVYGVDDGARTEEMMYEMLDLAVKDGIDRLVSTPHVTPGLKRFDMDLYERHFAKAVAYCRDKGYGIELSQGAELLYTPAADRFIIEEEIKTLDDSDYVLIEFSTNAALSEMEHAIDLLERTGYQPIVAHMERYSCLFRPGSVEKLDSAHDIMWQVNAETIVEKQGFIRGKVINGWLKNHTVDFIACDAHSTKHRTFRMTQAHKILAEKYGQGYADKVTGAAK